MRFLRRLFCRNVIDVEKIADAGGYLSLVEVNPDKDYFVIIREGYVNISDVLAHTPRGLGQFTIVRVR